MSEPTINHEGFVEVLTWKRKRYVPLKEYNSLADHANERDRKVDACRRDYRGLEAAARALLESLPTCPSCATGHTERSRCAYSKAIAKLTALVGEP